MNGVVRRTYKWRQRTCLCGRAHATVRPDADCDYAWQQELARTRRRHGLSDFDSGEGTAHQTGFHATLARPQTRIRAFATHEQNSRSRCPRTKRLRLLHLWDGRGRPRGAWRLLCFSRKRRNGTRQRWRRTKVSPIFNSSCSVFFTPRPLSFALLLWTYQIVLLTSLFSWRIYKFCNNTLELNLIEKVRQMIHEEKKSAIKRLYKRGNVIEEEDEEGNHWPTVVELISMKPADFGTNDGWRLLCEHWSTPESRNKSLRGKRNRLANGDTVYHSGGARSLVATRQYLNSMELSSMKKLVECHMAG
ncbi:hypothetical protein ACQ4PT_053049 [Festuca glaucescens]